MWFRQVEAQFETSNPPITTDSTKFSHVIASLDNATAVEVEAIILSPPPTTDKYPALKAAHINAVGMTQAAKDKQLLSLSGLGDRKPSSLLRHMESLNADPKTLLRALFLAQLPTEVRRVLAGSSTTDLRELAKEADAIMEVGSTCFSATGISGVQKSSPPSTTPQRRLCFYHAKFGKEARKCNQQGCRMGHLVLPSTPTPTLSPASGNGQAGR